VVHFFLVISCVHWTFSNIVVYLFIYYFSSIYFLVSSRFNFLSKFTVHLDSSRTTRLSKRRKIDDVISAPRKTTSVIQQTPKAHNRASSSSSSSSALPRASSSSSSQRPSFMSPSKPLINDNAPFMTVGIPKLYFFHQNFCHHILCFHSSNHRCSAGTQSSE
jgi:hypothetical protein